MDVNKQIAVKSVLPVRSVTPTVAITKRAVQKVQEYIPQKAINSKEVQNVVKENGTDGTILSVPDSALVKAIEHVNKVIQGGNVELAYSVHKATNTVVIKMIDKDTNEIIREIPSEKVLDVYVQRMALLGLNLDERG